MAFKLRLRFTKSRVEREEAIFGIGDQGSGIRRAEAPDWRSAKAPAALKLRNGAARSLDLHQARRAEAPDLSQSEAVRLDLHEPAAPKLRTGAERRWGLGLAKRNNDRRTTRTARESSPDVPQTAATKSRPGRVRNRELKAET
jgi:hypothetical protein